MKLSGLSIKNFGCFDDKGCEIKIDDIVILIGQNNTGKSTILDAYEAFASSGAELKLSNFKDEKTDKPIEIVGIFTEITSDDTDALGSKCVHNDPNYGMCIKVMFRWTEPNKKGEKFTYQNATGVFEKGGAGGWDSLIASRIPVPLRITPTDTHEKIEAIIIEILTTTVKDSLKKDKTKIVGIVKQLEALTEEFAKEIEEELKTTTTSISDKLSQVFPNYTAEFQPEIGTFESEKVIGAGSHIRIKEAGKISLPLSQQGSGIQRSFLWATISALAEVGKMKKGTKKIDTTDKARILLIDEPEAFLHPPTIRAAREALYNLAEVSNWQVMASTHSPIFIDVSKPHTTIIRVEKDEKWKTKLISTDKITFDGDGVGERETLAMIRACHPTVNEFFFADSVILVEGETEQLIYSHLLQKSEHKNKIHIVSCFGKANIPLFAKILNHFGISYIAVHDSDSPRVLRKSKWITNSMWTMNEKIYNTVNENKNGAYAIVQIPYFEKFYFNEETTGDKPYKAHLTLVSSEFETNDQYKNLREFYESIDNGTHIGIYKDYDEFVVKVKEYVGRENPQPIEKWVFPES